MVSRSSLVRLGVLVVFTGAAAVLFRVVPSISLGGTAVRTALVVAAVGGVFCLWSGFRRYRDGRPRAAAWFVLLGVGLPLSLVDRPVVPWVGVAFVLASVAVSWQLDGRLRALFSNES
ncbi:hypothetical protein SAMN04487949_1611 [Halogranum gelatinilyticum]|uniref:Uncharacterized protein n=1 Tax=Halogranum gelatinilyticum TaxID=660521 RepID=A0A1G9T415_9EURY|nr:hypothetical protein [Halogranum gelatinilyticum]SDM42494.1 hypothetical protein SAMN04487949_1611 [Halogranum gelatinilyticum]